MTKKLKVSKEIAEALEMAKKLDLNISEILKFENKNYPFKEQFKALTELSKEDLITGLFYEYEIEKIEILPHRFKFKHNNHPIIYQAVILAADNSLLIVSYLDDENEIRMTSYPVKKVIDFINDGIWVMI